MADARAGRRVQSVRGRTADGEAEGGGDAQAEHVRLARAQAVDEQTCDQRRCS